MMSQSVTITGKVELSTQAKQENCPEINVLPAPSTTQEDEGSQCEFGSRQGSESEFSSRVGDNEGSEISTVPDKYGFLGGQQYKAYPE